MTAGLPQIADAAAQLAMTNDPSHPKRGARMGSLLLLSDAL